MGQRPLGGAYDIQVWIDKNVGRSWRPERFPGLAHGDDGLLGLDGSLRWVMTGIVQFEDEKSSLVASNIASSYTQLRLEAGAFWQGFCLPSPPLDCAA